MASLVFHLYRLQNAMSLICENIPYNFQQRNLTVCFWQSTQKALVSLYCVLLIVNNGTSSIYTTLNR